MRVLFVLPGIFRVARGAEVALLAIARGLARRGWEVTVFGGGTAPDGEPFAYRRIPCGDRRAFERWPRIPVLRDEFCYEEATFVPGLLRAYDPERYDVTVTCSYPFTNWILGRRTRRGYRPRHVFVTQNGDWPAVSSDSEYRWFSCDGLVCINPDYLARNREAWNCRLIPNGLDYERFRTDRDDVDPLGGRGAGRTRILMVSALTPYKRVEVAIEACARIPDVHLVVAGDGPLRARVEASAEELLPGRFTRLQLDHGAMPALYRSCDVFLHLALDEPFGNVFTEAMASGLPIVAHDASRTRWIVGDEEFLTDSSDPDRIAAAIERARAEGPRGRPARIERASAFDWNTITDAYADYLGELGRCHARTRSEALP